MKEEEILAVLRLQNAKSVGDILAKKLIATVGSAEAVFTEKKHLLQKINGIGSFTIQHLLDESNLGIVEKELDYIQRNNIKFTYFLDDDYPQNLQHCIDAPILLFQDGNMNLSNERIISIVGTRNMTRYGQEFCEQFIEALTPYNPIIVSGFAYGVDICAHKAAFKNKLQTIAVLAHGLEQIYPKVHKRYIHQVNENGGFLTEFFHHETPQRENFLKRNRIVAGISKATVIIESAKKGGSLVTADIANSYDRDVFAVPGKVTDRMSMGCNDLIRNHRAHLLQSAEDLIKMLNWDTSTGSVQDTSTSSAQVTSTGSVQVTSTGSVQVTSTGSAQKVSSPKQQQLFIELSEEEQKVYDHLQSKGQQLLDVIAFETHVPVYQLATILLQMELKGVIKPLPGKMFDLT